MISLNTNQKKNQALLHQNELVGEIHDVILDNNNLDLALAYNDACVWIAELHLEIEKIQKTASSGFLRRKPSKD